MKKPLNNIASLAERTHQFLDKINSREAIITITHEELTKKDLSILQSQNIIESVSKKLTTLYDAISFENFTARHRITSYNVCYTKLLRKEPVIV